MWLAIAARFGLYTGLLVLFGLAAFARFGLPPAVRDGQLNGPLRRVLLMLWGVATASSVLALLASTAQMSGTALFDVDLESIRIVLFEMTLGRAWIVQVASLAVAGCCMFPARPRWSGLTTLSGVALATLVWAGHSAADEGLMGWLHRTADIVHLAAVASWLGALAGFTLLLRASLRRPSLLHITHRGLTAFGRVGTGLVAAIVLTGLINSWFTVGLEHARTLLATDYGALLAVKLVLFISMLMFASLNRFRLTPALGRDTSAGETSRTRRALALSVLLEASLGLAVLATVAWLGMLEPPNSAM